MTQPIEALRDAHKGETAYIIGKGPSLANLTEEMLGPGPIIALNHAILRVRGYRVPLYSSQKDGCVLYGARHPGAPCLSEGKVTAPEPPEILLVSQHESPDCFDWYEPRYIFDCQGDFGLQWNTPSAPVAVHIAALMGCVKVVMVSHDAHTKEDHRIWLVDHLADGSSEGYSNSGSQAEGAISALHLAAEWMTPE